MNSGALALLPADDSPTIPTIDPTTPTPKTPMTTNTDTTTEIVTLPRLAVIVSNMTRNGQFFGCGWHKKDGTYRTGTFRNSKTMSKGKNGKGMSYDPDERGLVTVYDTGLQKYRMIQVDGLQWVKTGGKVYKVDGAEGI